MTSLTHPLGHPVAHGDDSPTWNRGLPTIDPIEQMERDDRSDWVFLRLVVCVAVATLALAMASTLPV